MRLGFYHFEKTPEGNVSAARKGELPLKKFAADILTPNFLLSTWSSHLAHRCVCLSKYSWPFGIITHIVHSCHLRVLPPVLRATRRGPQRRLRLLEMHGAVLHTVTCGRMYGLHVLTGGVGDSRGDTRKLPRGVPVGSG